MSSQREAQKMLIQSITENAAIFLNDCAILKSITSGKVDEKAWCQFAIQRYLAAEMFEDVLEACKEKALKNERHDLARVIEENLRDERGEDARGVIHREHAHATWRKDFYHTLGIKDQELQPSASTKETACYAQTLQDIIASDDELEMAGAILLLEATIPREFLAIKKGRDMTFAKTFVDQWGDDKEVRAQKRKARMYIDDHIVHDAKAHYPDLRKVCEKYASSSEQERIRSGMQKIAQAKKVFTVSLCEVYHYPRDCERDT